RADARARRGQMPQPPPRFAPPAAHLAVVVDGFFDPLLHLPSAFNEDFFPPIKNFPLSHQTNPPGGSPKVLKFPSFPATPTIPGRSKPAPAQSNRPRPTDHRTASRDSIRPHNSTGPRPPRAELSPFDRPTAIFDRPTSAARGAVAVRPSHRNPTPQPTNSAR